MRSAFLISPGGPDGDKAGKDKSRVGRSQSQRPAGDRERGARRPTAASCKVSGRDAGAQPELVGGTGGTNITSATSPPGGASAALQPETGDGPDVQPEETSAPPLRRGDGGTRGKDELESGPASEPREGAESAQLPEGNTNSDCSTRWLSSFLMSTAHLPSRGVRQSYIHLKVMLHNEPVVFGMHGGLSV